MPLIRRLFVGIARRKHHAFDTEVHHFVEEGANTVRIGAVKQRRVGSDSETALDRLTNAFDGLIVAAFATNREVVMLALPVDVDGKRQIFARLEEVELLLEQERFG